MGKDVEFLAAARRELAEAAEWYDERKPGLGAEFWEAIHDAIVLVSESPQGFAVAFSSVRRASVKRFPYSIYYRDLERTVLVVAIYHNSRDSATLRRRVHDQKDS